MFLLLNSTATFQHPKLESWDKVVADVFPVCRYLLFAKERRKEIQKEWPMYTFAEVTRMIGTEWSEMDVDRKVYGSLSFLRSH